MAAVDLHLPAFVHQGEEDVYGFDQRALGGLTPDSMVGSDFEVDWASTAQHKIDLANMEATGIKLTPPIEAPTAAADPDPAGLTADPEEDPDDEIDFYAMLNLDDTTEDPFAMAPGGSSGQLFPVNLLADTGDMEMPVYPVIPDDMDVDDLYSFFAPSPARNMGDGEGSSNISATGHDTEMTDDDTAAEGKLVGETLSRVRDQSIQPEIAEPEDSGERPICSPLVEAPSVDRNSLEPEYMTANANSARDQLRENEVRSGGHFDILEDGDDYSDVSSPPDSPDCVMSDSVETRVTEPPAAAFEDWRIKFARDLLPAPRTTRRPQPETSAANATPAQDERREMHSDGGHSNIFADVDSYSDVSSPPNSPDYVVSDNAETRVTEESAAATKDWRIKFARDLLPEPRTTRLAARSTSTGLITSKAGIVKSRKNAETSTAAASTPALGGAGETTSSMVPGCFTCSNYFAGQRGRAQTKTGGSSCCEPSLGYSDLLSGIINGTEDVSWNEETMFNCGSRRTVNRRCETCKSRRVTCWTSKGSVDAFRSGAGATDTISESPMSDTS